MPIRVAVIDDEAKLRAAWERVLVRESDMECTAALPCADTLAEVAARTDTDVALLDLTMPGKDPLEAIADMRAGNGRCRVVVYSAHRDPRLVESALAAGAWGFVDKLERIEHVLDALRRVAAGETAIPAWFGPAA